MVVMARGGYGGWVEIWLGWVEVRVAGVEIGLGWVGRG